VGVDFIQKTKRSFEKHLDIHRVNLGTADFFTRDPIERRPAFPADLAGGSRPKVGDELIAEVEGSTLVLSDKMRVVAFGDGIAPAILQAVEDSCGLATAIVQEVHELSGVIEVTLC
jgi:hypothetical protein